MDSTIIRYKQIVAENQYQSIKSEKDVWSLYLYAIKQPVTREKYTKRLEKFFDFMNLQKKERQQKMKKFFSFVSRKRFESNQWVFNNVLRFMQVQLHLERINRKEITDFTIRNYLKSIKLFYEMADIPISWKKISRGLPKGKNYADVEFLQSIRQESCLNIQIED